MVVEVGEGVTDLSPGDRVAYGAATGSYCHGAAHGDGGAGEAAERDLRTRPRRR